MKHTLIITIALLFFISCKKEENPAQHDYSHYVGVFYGEKTSSTEFGSHVSTTTSDYVLSTNTTPYSVSFLGTSFDLNNPETTFFSYSASDYSKGASLSYSNNFNSISYSSSQNLGGGASGADSFSGSKTQLPLTDATNHPLKSQLEGQYVLNVYKYDYLNAIDTTYIDTFSVAMDGFSPSLDNNVFYFGRYHSYINTNQMNPSDDYHLVKNLRWSVDSLFIDYKTIYGVFGGAADTVHYIYSGWRM